MPNKAKKCPCITEEGKTRRSVCCCCMFFGRAAIFTRKLAPRCCFVALRGLKMSESSDSNSVLFVCLGNICRSPIAEAVFKHVAKERGVLDDWTVDSAATGDWHVGCNPDKRALKCLKDHGIDYKHSARQVTTEDFTNFKYIFGMDEEQYLDTARAVTQKEYGSNRTLREDDGSKGFEDAYEQCLRCSNAFLDRVVS
ncbi:hypothetical protein HPB51_000104 [Rhipicephalus microplus]|uniref:Phosphotyrosine protein phosphatase I domain-containing protein n=1 Tax=Rhipicephalus microplus TaxID=6941 RepID=A0A9J6EJE9_RHIMP|nr:hypothetical protein HPB51_000104 [Rhipicephalus microplus]